MKKQSICFTGEDLALFSAASHDRNPLHVSDVYARATPYGEPVVFGILGALAALSHLPDRQGVTLRELSLEFRNPMTAGIEYALQVQEMTPGQYVVKMHDADRLMMKATFTFQNEEGNWQSLMASEHPLRKTAAEWKKEDFLIGRILAGTYCPSTGDFEKVIERWGLSEKGISADQIACMMWTSFMVGMELPGKQAIYWRLGLVFEPDHGQLHGPLDYSVKMEEFDERLELLHTVGNLSIDEKAYAKAHMWAFVRQDSPRSSMDELTTLMVGAQQLKGKVALVIGGSRGLGAAISQALALQGCSVLVNYHRCKEEAEHLRSSVRSQSELIELVQGDAADIQWCQELRRHILTKYKGLDFLICNASPPIRPLPFRPEKFELFQDFLNKSLALVSAPMATFLSAVTERAGWNVVISSAFVRDLPAEWPHYVTAKSAIEGLVQWAAAQYPEAHSLIVRPPKLLTDQTNTTMGRQRAMRVEQAAASIVGHLCNTTHSKSFQVLERF